MGHVNPSMNNMGVGNAHSVLRGTNAASALSSVPRHTTSWNHASQGQLQHVNSNLNHAVKTAGTTNHNLANNLHTSSTVTPQRAQTLANQGNTIRNNWANGNHRCFNNNWWIGRSMFGFGGFGWWGGWGYSPWLNYYPWWYWWGSPGWGACSSYLPYGWNNGYYYDYGHGGNIAYQNGNVVVDGQVVGSDAEYAQSAAALAVVDPAELKAVQPADWLALGTFSMAVKDSEVDPSRVIQLAVSKNGLISGTIHNRTSGNTYAVQGRVDKETQRVAFTIEDDSNTVMETGIYNLTQDQTPVLCHFGTSATQVYMLARLPQPEHEPADATTPPLPGTPPAPGADAPPAPAPAPAAPPTGVDTSVRER